MIDERLRKAAEEAYLMGFRGKSQRRSIGMESEHPIVMSDGRAGSIQPIFEVLRSEEWEPVLKGKQISGYKDPKTGSIVVPEAGQATLELNTPPAKSLDELNRTWESVLSRLVPAVRSTEQHLLGLGIQPVSGPRDLGWAASKRYEALQRSFGSLDSVLTTASIQAHVDVQPEEIGRVMNGMNLLSGVVLALTANAPFRNGKLSELLTLRAASYEAIASKGLRRTGMLDQSFETSSDVIGYLLRMDYPFYPNGGEDFSDWGRPFHEFIAEKNLSSPRDIRPHLLLHEGMWWPFGGRIRSAYGTAEFRAPCQQPPGEQMAVQALILGLVENNRGVDRLCRAIPRSSWHEAMIVGPIAGLDGRAREHSMRKLASEVLRVAEEGIESRQMGEERYLYPLIDRVEERVEIPAKRAVAVFQKSGISGLIQEFQL